MIPNLSPCPAKSRLNKYAAGSIRKKSKPVLLVATILLVPTLPLSPVFRRRKNEENVRVLRTRLERDKTRKEFHLLRHDILVPIINSILPSIVVVSTAGPKLTLVCT